jgi:sugar phosphate isomerase/epimerase
VAVTAEALPAMSALGELLSLNEGLVGPSTGYMVGARGDWPRLVAAAETCSLDVVELSALSAEELPGLLRFLDEAAAAGLPFGHISVHGPSKGWDGTPAALASALGAIPAFVDGIVLHPETLGDVAAFAGLGARLRLENMDTRKRDARTVAELARYFDALPHAHFCFDVAHAQLHDPSLGLAHELLDAFADRLAEVHISSIEPDGEHTPLRAADAEAFLPVLERCTGVPWVLEAPAT